MSKSRSAKLAVSAPAGVTVTVLNSDLEPVAGGAGDVEEQLPVGLYEIQWLAGRELHQQVVRLATEGLSVVPDPSDLRSAPSSSANDEAMRVAERDSHDPAIRLGTGARVLIVVQDDDPRARSRAAVGMTLRRSDGHRLIDVDEQSHRSHRGEHPLWSVTSAELDPGAYRLRVATGDAGSMEQTIMLVDGWQTQVFLRRRSWGSAQRGRFASLPDATITMAKSAAGFDPSNPDVTLTELARQGLSDDKQVLSARDLERLVYGKWTNPLLGLLGAHFLQRSGEHPRLLAEARKNLRRLLGDHPDVVALEADAGVIEGPVEVPPMLAASWELLVKASVEVPPLIPPDALTGRIAGRLFGSGAWLVWRPPQRSAQRREAAPAPPDLTKAAQDLSAAIQAQPEKVGERRKSLDDTASSAIAVAAEIAKGRAHASLSDKEIVERMKLPRSVAEEAFGAAIRAFRN